MARKAKRSFGDGLGLSDGVRQSLLAIFLAATAVILLLSFFDLAGTVGLSIDSLMSNVFGWDRWFFSVILLAVGWSAIFPDRRLLSPINLLGLALCFIAFNGLLNLFFVPDPANLGNLSAYGGYLGLLMSVLALNFLSFWGALAIAITILVTGIVLTFSVSFSSLGTVHRHLTEAGRSWHDRRTDQNGSEESDQDGSEDEVEGEFEEIEGEADEEADEDEEEPKHKPIQPPAEGLMTSPRTRRKVDIPFELLDDKSSVAKSGDVNRNAEIIVRTLSQFGIESEVSDIRVGPTVTQFALRPPNGVKLARIVALQNDLALALAAHPIRIEAPIPGRSLVGIEVPNLTIGRVCLRELLQSTDFKKRKTDFTAPLGKDVSGAVPMISVDKAPHMLVAGATGSGKSVCLNVIIVSLLYQNGPDDLKFIMVDPKRVELGVYAGIPHLLVPPIVKVDEAINALKWAVREMERRLDHLAKFGVRDIDAYNAKAAERMPKIVIVIDELADLMSQNKRDVEAVIVRIAQMARAAGIHLVLATQRPSVDVITGTIKANIPTRLAFAVASQVDSKTILDIGGAEKLLGRGDMLMQTPELSKPKRLQGAYLADSEIERVIEFLKKDSTPDYNYQITEDARTGGTAFDATDADSMFEEAAQVVIDGKKASTSYLQRRLKIGYSRAARIMDMLEEAGVIGAGEGAKPREVLVDSWPPAGMDEMTDGTPTADKRDYGEESEDDEADQDVGSEDEEDPELEEGDEDEVK